MINLRFSLRLPDGDRTAAEQAVARSALFGAAVDMVAWCEDRGCVAATLSEHHSSPDGYLPSPLVLAAAIASRTKTIPIVIAALLALLYDPVRLAEDLSVLDHLSRGRVFPVFGMGYRDEEYAMFGVDSTTRGAQMEALLVFLRQAWSGQPVEYPGRGMVQITPLPFTPGGPPLGYGGHSVAAARRAARHGLMFLAEAGGEHLRDAYEDEARRLGIEPAGCQLSPADSATTVFVAEDPDAAWHELGPVMLHEIRIYREWNRAAGKSGIASISGADSVEELRAEGRGYRIYTPSEAAALAGQGAVLTLEPLCGGLAPERAWAYLETAVSALAPQ
jgi:alkanesulfonate monooxygenase SsuD/methylene tetrahydromethanopterin reductase-like flavin-dependent oxidoreductase (luciferase family)